MSTFWELLKDLFTFFNRERQHRQVERLNDLFYFKEQELPPIEEMKAHYTGGDDFQLG